MKIVISRLLFIAIAALGIYGCSSDAHTSSSGTITLDKSGIFVWSVGESTSTKYTSKNIVSIKIKDIPDGWEITANESSRTITAVSPADISPASGNSVGGRATVVGYTSDNVAVPVFLEVGVVDRYDFELQGEQSNSMIATEPNTYYTFNPMCVAEKSDETLATASCKIIWQSNEEPIKYLEKMSDGNWGFYTAYDNDDIDEDGKSDDVVEGNAVIGAYNTAGVLLWSWHIWVTEDDPRLTTVTLDGAEFMGRNLGSQMNSNITNDDIDRSQGLFYQWGRKDPFPFAEFYNAQGGYDGAIINGDGAYVYITYAARSAKNGSVDFAVQNPTTFIYTSDTANRDWLNTPINTLWGDGSQKSIYDPSPRGWRVPSTFGDIEVEYNAANSYSATLSDGVNQDLFMALGRRTYLKGLIENINPVSPTLQAPGGYYWTADSVSESFVFNEQSVINSVSYSAEYPTIEASLNARANGMQIRCIKE